MKKIWKIFFFLLFAVAVIPSCELLADCKTCRLITNDNGSISEGSGILFCGPELEERENSTPKKEGNITSYWECNEK